MLFRLLRAKVQYIHASCYEPGKFPQDEDDQQADPRPPEKRPEDYG